MDDSIYSIHTFFSAHGIDLTRIDITSDVEKLKWIVNHVDDITMAVNVAYPSSVALERFGYNTHGEVVSFVITAMYRVSYTRLDVLGISVANVRKRTPKRGTDLELFIGFSYAVLSELFMSANNE